ncbi:MAG: MCE family protein [Bacteroidetes bacterium]|nr:MCE family protein [Bacteroidota bacterium]
MKAIDNVKLGLFVLISIAALVFLFYVVSKKNIWSSAIELRAQFKNVQGLQKGNNVRYGGIHIGTVTDIYLVNDTTVEVLMVIDGEARKHIQTTSVATIVTDGFVGDKLVNISGAARVKGQPISDGDLIKSKQALDMDVLMELVDSPEAGVKTLLTNVNQILQKVDNSGAVWELAGDQALLSTLRQTILNLQQSSGEAAHLMQEIRATVGDVSQGRGIVGAVLNDTSYVTKLDALLTQTNQFTQRANTLLAQVQNTVGAIDNDINKGSGVAHTLMKDSTLVNQIDSNLVSLQKGLNSFNEVMDALKNSFFLRKQIRRNQKARKPD